MINNLSILFSLLVVIYVIVRASMLDVKRPWFERAPGPESPPEPAPEFGRAGAASARQRRR